ncbi:hypothetical protein GGR42_001518 [Saonia flava]|uniref:DUF4260 domain-containing protein n=1 Tax=Saonia flava TaxID=523696 RepID=A0A846QPT1_9FLAO|nr:DUF4260 domain-containing protein [Saonia flava]NJB71056.1 hypothetical protein [Saonia flava]
MKLTLKIEELGMFLLGMFLFSQLQYQWWWFLVLLLTPDIGMLGYLFGNKVGAFMYNIFHHKGLAVLIYFLGLYWSQTLCQLVGIILFSHASFDRIFGYGLKYDKGFKYTHLGEIGNNG